MPRDVQGTGRRIGVIGTGFVARHFVRELQRRADWTIAGVLTRRTLDRVEGFPYGCLTQHLDDLLEAAELVDNFLFAADQLDRVARLG